MTDLDLKLYVDVMCAHSHLAYSQLRAALADIRAAGHTVTLHVRPLLIVPDAPIGAYEPLREVHRRVFGPNSLSTEHAMTQRATSAGVPIHYERAQFTSTIPALAAILQAQDHDPNLGEELLAALFRAYFVDGAVISDLDWLASSCARHGVLGLEFTTDQLDRVREASRNARRHGINSAPTLQLPGGDLIVGGRERGEYASLIEQGGGTTGARG